MEDDPRAWLLENDEPATADEALDAATETETTTRSRRQPKWNLTPEAFFVLNMMLFFVACLLSLVVLLITGRIMPG